jgi:dipeptidyl aminopeptidase/acylaminoacyl peptidase
VLAGGLVMLAAIVLVCVPLTSTASAAYPGTDGRIAFVRAHAIYTIGDTGTGLRRLTHTRRCSDPRWSPNGKKLAYVCGGDLWIMAANGSHKTRVTTPAPRYSDSRPSWSPDGRYLAFVKTKHGHHHGYLTRYNTATHGQVTFSTPYQSENPTARQVKVTAVPAPVAWGWALSGSSYGSFILFEGAGSSEFCHSNFYCLDALGAPSQSQYRNQFPSAEDQTAAPTRLLDPDWFPNSPQFDTDALTTQESCGSGGCTATGIDLRIEASPIHAGGYQAVYSPSGGQIAYVQNRHHVPTIYVASINPATSDVGTVLTGGTEPDWQPLPQTAQAVWTPMTFLEAGHR